MLKTISWAAPILLAIAAFLIVFGLVKLANKSRGMTPQLGLTKGRLAACPDTPNCVSSQSNVKEKSIKPIAGGKNAFKQLTDSISSAPGTIIINQTENYLHATYKSAFFGFIDDLELYLHDGVIEVRSASRVGKSDLGANRKRTDALRAIVK